MEQAFLRAILDDPDNDLPRLIYADWLEEQGDPRAEFIRVQCELARWPLHHDRFDTLDQRNRELLEAHKTEWLADRDGFPLELIHFYRGFPHRITAGTGPIYDDMIVRLLDSYPTITSIRYPGNLSDEVLHRLTRLDGLHFASILSEPGLRGHFERSLVACHAFFSWGDAVPDAAASESIRHLGFTDGSVEWTRIDWNFPRLESLAISRHHFTHWDRQRQRSEQFLEFLSADFQPRLAWLSLRQCHVRGETLRQLLQTGHRERLKALNLSQNKLTDADARLLLETEAFPNLEILVLWDHRISPQLRIELRNKYGPGVRFDRRIPDEWDRWR